MKWFIRRIHIEIMQKCYGNKWGARQSRFYELCFRASHHSMKTAAKSLYVEFLKILLSFCEKPSCKRSDFNTNISAMEWLYIFMFCCGSFLSTGSPSWWIVSTCKGPNWSHANFSPVFVFFRLLNSSSRKRTVSFHRDPAHSQQKRHEATHTHTSSTWQRPITATRSAALECRPRVEPSSTVRVTRIVKGGKFQHASSCQHFIVCAVDWGRWVNVLGIFIMTRLYPECHLHCVLHSPCVCLVRGFVGSYLCTAERRSAN